MMKVREATKKDAAVLVEFQKAMARETEDIKLDDATIRRGITALFEDPSKGRYIIAEEDGEPAGCLMTTYEWSDWRNGTILWIQSVYVSPKHRRKGALTALYNHIKKEVVASQGLKGIRLYADKRNLNAQKAYERLGMSAEHYKTYEWIKS
jgi:RimJ/RimL family protein N-acetyltransferase